jgi:hypothetical protein
VRAESLPEWHLMCARGRRSIAAAKRDNPKSVNANREDGDFGLADLANEAWGPAAELALLLVEPFFWGAGARRGDGRPMLVLPGLHGGDRYLGPLRDWLRRIGYSPVPSGLHRNPGGRSRFSAKWGNSRKPTFSVAVSG